MLRIRLLGGLEVDGPEGPRPPLPTQSSRNLLGFLALHPGRRHRRDVVAGRLWGDRTDRSAQKALRNGLWRLRCALEAEDDSGLRDDRSDSCLDVEGPFIGLLSDVWTDVEAFERYAGHLPRDGTDPLTDDQVTGLEEAVGLYRGDLLHGMYDDWVCPRRDELRERFVDVLEALFRQHVRDGDLRSAVARGRGVLRENPFLEHVHRDLMLCHWRMGDRPLAVRQYRECESILRDELDLEPMPETRRLLQSILDGSATELSFALSAMTARDPLRSDPGSPRARRSHRYSDS